MSLRAIDPAPASVDLVRDQLPRLVGAPTLAGHLTALVTSTDVALVLPHRVYALGLEQLAGGADLGAATAVAEEFLLMDGSDPVCTVEVRDPAGHIQLGGGSFAAMVVRAVRDAEQQPDLDGAEVRLLLVSALHFTALWLHAPVARDETLVPLGRTPSTVETGRFYDAGEQGYPCSPEGRGTVVATRTAMTTTIPPAAEAER